VAGGRRTWLDGRIDVLLAALDDYGMDASRVSAAELIQERVQWVAAHLRVTPATARRYLTDETVRDLARTMVVTVADEAPGADLLASARTASVPVPVLGRCIAGLSEAIVLRLAERDDLDHVRTTTAQLAQALSALGQVIAGQHATGDIAAGTASPRAGAAGAAEPCCPLPRGRRGDGARRRSLAGRIRPRPRDSARRHLRGRRGGHALLQ
jgi:hypothetical protein